MSIHTVTIALQQQNKEHHIWQKMRLHEDLILDYKVGPKLLSQNPSCDKDIEKGYDI